MAEEKNDVIDLDKELEQELDKVDDETVEEKSTS